jgi:hypothetical protein
MSLRFRLAQKIKYGQHRSMVSMAHGLIGYPMDPIFRGAWLRFDKKMRAAAE